MKKKGISPIVKNYVKLKFTICNKQNILRDIILYLVIYAYKRSKIEIQVPCEIKEPASPTTFKDTKKKTSDPYNYNRIIRNHTILDNINYFFCKNSRFEGF